VAPKKPVPKKVAAKKAAPPRRAPAAPRTPGVMGEGDWKSDEKYTESLQEWGAGHDAEALAREAESVLPEDLRESDDQDVADAAARGAEKKEEADEEW